MAEILHLVGWLFVVLLVYAAVQGYIGLREFDATLARVGGGSDMVAAVEQQNSPRLGGIDFLGLNMLDAAVNGVEYSRGGYYKAIAIDLGLAAVVLWLLDAKQVVALCVAVVLLWPLPRWLMRAKKSRPMSANLSDSVRRQS